MSQDRAAPLRPSPSPAPAIALSLVIGSLGGVLFFWLDLPLAWMLGAMAATTIAALCRLPVGQSSRLRDPMIAILGTLLGGTFSIAIVDKLAGWAAGAGLVCLTVVVLTALTIAYFRRIGRLDPVTSFFCATPGGLGQMTLIGEAEGGDPRAIAIVHALRIVVVVFLIPFYLRYVEGFEIPATSTVGADQPLIGIADLAILALGALAGLIVAKLLRLPAAALVGPMIASAALYMTGTVEGRIAAPAIAVAQIVVGAMIGARFVGTDLAAMRTTIVLAIGSGVAMIALAIALSALAAPALGLDRHALLLALAPGGLAEMSMIALALDVDTAFISTMHVVRIFLIMIVAPLLFRRLGWRAGGATPRPH